MMNPLKRAFFVLAVIAFFPGCAAQRASFSDSIPMMNVNQCRSLCESVQMELQSIVIVANQTGCVCGVKNASSGATAAASGGAVTLLMEQEERRAQGGR